MSILNEEKEKKTIEGVMEKIEELKAKRDEFEKAKQRTAEHAQNYNDVHSTLLSFFAEFEEIRSRIIDPIRKDFNEYRIYQFEQKFDILKTELEKNGNLNKMKEKIDDEDDELQILIPKLEEEISNNPKMVSILGEMTALSQKAEEIKEDIVDTEVIDDEEKPIQNNRLQNKSKKRLTHKR